MAFFLKLTSNETDRHAIFVNIDQVTSFRRYPQYTEIKFGTQRSDIVTETPKEIIAALDESRRMGVPA